MNVLNLEVLMTMTDQAVNKAPVVYEAEPTLVKSLQKAKENIWSICEKHMHCRVRVQLLDGQMAEGHITGADHRHLYLRVDPPAAMQARQFPFSPFGYGGFYNPYASYILPLVLFDLLAIALI